MDMQESLTVLAGPNNSGKTTLISVLKGMFCDKKLGFSYSDIPISLSSMWLEKTVPVFQEIMHEYDKEKGVQKIIDEMTDNDKLSKDYTIDNFRAQIQVDYDPDSDNIQYFADYLMDLDDTKHSFYFIYTYEPSITAFEKGLNERYNRMAARVRDIKNPGCIEKETKFYFLVLYLMNKEKYEEIGAKNLYDAYRSMEEYTFGRKYSSTDVLSDMSNDNPDILMKFLFLLNNVIGLYIDKNYGMVISICKKENKYFDSSQFKIKKHADKKSIKNKFDKIIEIYEKDGCLIKEVIESLFDNGFIPEKVKNDFEENIEYQKVLDIEMKEVSNLANYLSMPHISTQHGVKGESHTSVIFVASDNVNTPNVRMYPFFELWSKLEFSLPQFEELFYSYSKIIEEVEKLCLI